MTELRDESIEPDALLVIADIIRGMQDGSRTPWAITDAAVFMGHLRRRGLVVTTKERAEVGEALPLLRRILARSSWYPSGMVTLPAAIVASMTEWRALLRLADSER